jgi:hypothetical protein
LAFPVRIGDTARASATPAVASEAVSGWTGVINPTDDGGFANGRIDFDRVRIGARGHGGANCHNREN